MLDYNSNKRNLSIVARLDWLLIGLAVTSSLIGIIILYSGSEAGESLAIRNIFWLIISLIVMFVMAFTNYQKLGSYAFVIYILGIILLILVLIPFIGTKVKGARSWIRFLGLGFQPEYTPIMFAEMIRNNITFSKDTRTMKNALKMDNQFNALVGKKSVTKSAYFARFGRSKQPTSRSIRKPLHELLIK